MIDHAQAEYEQIEAKAAELARQFWAEIEAGLAQQSSALSAAISSDIWQKRANSLAPMHQSF